jgi:hypothetical protein
MRHYRQRAAQYRDLKRALWAGAAVVLICAGSLYIASTTVRSSDQLRNAARNGQGAGAGASASASGGNETGAEYLKTGSILFVPHQGNICRERLIDNKTWFIFDKGYVVCDEAVSWNANVNVQTSYSPIARVDAIRGFFKK